MDLAGHRYKRLLVIKKGKRVLKNTTVPYWLCVCDCGTEKEICQNSLRSGLTQSCGCLVTEWLNSPHKHGYIRNKKKTSEYIAWQNMKYRYCNINNPEYKNYGGRGITVCDRWLNSFENFLADMGFKPTPEHSLDRFPDVNGDYEKQNCRWATTNEQTKNQRRTVRYTINGETLVQEDWGRRLGISSSTIIYLLKKGKTFKEIYDRFI